MSPLFVTGIGTGVGKTVASAVLVEGMGMDYWKPIQAGDLKNSDSVKIRRWVSRKDICIYPESYALKKPLSPHAAAKKEGKNIAVKNIKAPPSQDLVIEGAGGVLVPFNNQETFADLMVFLQIKLPLLEVVIVSLNYLGSINHSLLTHEALASRGLKIKGWVFNGTKNPETESLILKKTGAPLLFRINTKKYENKKVSGKVIKEDILHYAKSLRLPS